MKQMSSRERIHAAINHQAVDRVPFDFTITVPAYNKLVKHLGWDHLAVDNSMNIYSVAGPDPEFHEKMDLDCIYVFLNPPSGTPKLQWGKDQVYTDEFGQTYRLVTHGECSTEYELTNTPMADFEVEDLLHYNWPNPLDDAIFDGLYDRCRDYYMNTDKALVGYFRGTVFTTPSLLRGMAQWFEDLLLEPEFANALMAKFCDYYSQLYCKALDIAGQYISFLRVDMDDFGSQAGPLISAPLFREMVKPHLKRFYDNLREKFKEVNPECRLMKHSCGDNLIFMEDYIDLGIDVFDPVQPRTVSMSREALERFKGRIAFHGGIDTQSVLPQGSVEDVYAEVKDAIAHLASPSGYICASAHHVAGDVPPENILAMRDAVMKYGKIVDGKLVNIF